MLNHQPLPDTLVQFSQETTTYPGFACEGNPNPDVIHAGTAGCLLGSPARGGVANFVIIGDSHARMWTDGLNLFGIERQRSILMLAYSSCTPVLGYIAPTRPECAAIFDNVLNYVIQSPIHKIVLAGYWSSALADMDNSGKSNGQFKSQLAKTIHALKNVGKTVYILADIPELDSEHALRKHFIKSLRTKGTATTTLHGNWQKNGQLELHEIISQLRESHHIQLIETSDIICPSGVCKIVDQGRTLYRDRHHLTNAASQEFRTVFVPLLK